MQLYVFSSRPICRHLGTWTIWTACCALSCVSLPVKLSHLQDEHVLSEVVSVLEDDPDGVTGQGGGVGPLELQPQRLLLGRHHFALLNLNTGHICSQDRENVCVERDSREELWSYGWGEKEFG